MKVIPYKEVPADAIFRVLKNEKHSLKQRTADGRISELVLNDGHYFKVADSHAVNMVTGKDCIFSLNIPCRVISTNASFAKAAREKYGVLEK